DLLGVGDALRDLFTPLFQHREDAPVGEPVEDGAHDPEADDLRPQMLPVHAEGPGDMRDLASAFGDGQWSQGIHRCDLAVGTIAPGTGRRRRSLPRRRWRGWTGPKSAWTPRDCVPPRPKPSYRSFPRRSPRRTRPSQRGGFRSAPMDPWFSLPFFGFVVECRRFAHG